MKTKEKIFFKINFLILSIIVFAKIPMVYFGLRYETALVWVPMLVIGLVVFFINILIFYCYDYYFN